MVKDAEVHAEEDKKRRELVEVRNQAEALIHASEKTIAEAGDKLTDADRAPVEEAVAALKAVMDGENADEIRSKTEALGQVSMKLGEKLYQASSDTAAEATGNGAEGQDDGAGPDEQDEQVVDADFEEVDDDNKGKSA